MTVGTNSANRSLARVLRAFQGRAQLWSTLAATARVCRASFARSAARRQPRPLLAQIVVPLAVVAALLVQPWCAVGLLPCAWWWAPRRRGDEWVVAVGRGVVGAEWAWAGTNALASSSPTQRPLVAVCWISGAAIFAWLAYALSRP